MEIPMGTDSRRERRREYNERYVSKNPDKRKQSLDAYNNKAETKERVAQWHKDNADRVTASRKKWYEKNKELVFQKAREFAKQNPEWKAAHCAKRRSRKLRALPPWISAEQLAEIEVFYKAAKAKFKETGIPHHVDHIVPLQGKRVSGLHVPWNLQVISASENSKKSNHYENH